MLRAILAAAAILLAPTAHGADLPRTRALLQQDDAPIWIEGVVETIAIPWALLPIDDEAALADAVARHFDAGQIFDEIAARTAAALGDGHLQALVDWRATPLGARILAAETAFETPDCTAPDPACDVLARMEIMQDPRLGPLRRLNAGLNYARLDLAIDLGIQRAALEAGIAPPGEDALTPDEIEAALGFYADDNRAILVRWHEETTAAILAPFSAEEISAYADFVATDAVQIYLLAASGALNDALAARAGRLGRDFAGRGRRIDL